MRLMLITQDFPPEVGGIQTYSYEYARQLSKYCEYFAVIAPSKPDSKLTDKKLNFPVFRFNISNSLLFLKLYRELGNIVEQNNIDATFHAQWHTTLPAASLRNKGKLEKVFCAVHGRELLFNPYHKKFILENIYNRYRKNSLQKVDHLYPVSDFTSNELEKYGIEKDKKTVQHNGTDLSQFNKNLVDEKSRKRIIERYNLSGKKVVLTVCRLVSRKGVDIVIKAIKKLSDKYPDLVYIVIGSGPEMDHYKELARNLAVDDKVIFTGRVEDEKEFTAFYDVSDVFVMVPRSGKSNVEGFGIVYLEANAFGLPVIGSKSGGIPSAIADGETGLLVDEDNPEQLVTALDKLLGNRDYARKLGNNGLMRIKNELNWEVLGKKLYDDLQKKVSQTNGNA